MSSLQKHYVAHVMTDQIIGLRQVDDFLSRSLTLSTRLRRFMKCLTSRRLAYSLDLPSRIQMLLLLPDELLTLVLRVQDDELYRTLYNLMILSRRLPRIVLPILYRQPEVWGVTSMRCFCQSTQFHPEYATIVRRLHFHVWDDDDIRKSEWSALELPILPRCVELHICADYVGIDGCIVPFHFPQALRWSAQCPVLDALYLCGAMSANHHERSLTDHPEDLEDHSEDLEALTLDHLGLDGKLPKSLRTLGLDCIEMTAHDIEDFWSLNSSWVEILLIGTLDLRFHADFDDNEQYRQCEKRAMKEVRGILKSIRGYYGKNIKCLVIDAPTWEPDEAYIPLIFPNLEKYCCDAVNFPERFDKRFEKLQTLEVTAYYEGRDFDGEVDSLRSVRETIQLGFFPALRALILEGDNIQRKGVWFKDRVAQHSITRVCTTKGIKLKVTSIS